MYICVSGVLWLIQSPSPLAQLLQLTAVHLHLPFLMPLHIKDGSSEGSLLEALMLGLMISSAILKSTRGAAEHNVTDTEVQLDAELQ